MNMSMSLMTESKQAASNIRKYFTASQFDFMVECCQSGEIEEAYYFRQIFIDKEKEIAAMPVTYGQDGKGLESIAGMHYFYQGCHWYITELDMDGGVQQAFGYAILNGDDENAEMGYISIEELVREGVELDLYFTPCTIAEIKEKRAK